MTKKNNKSFLQTLMSLFISKTKKATPTRIKAKKTKHAKKSTHVGGMLRDGTVVRNMPKHS